MSQTWADGSAHPREELQDLLDGRLSATEADTVRAHLATCDACRHEWAQLEIGQAAAAQLRVERDMPADLLASVRASLVAEDGAPRAVQGAVGDAVEGAAGRSTRPGEVASAGEGASMSPLWGWRSVVGVGAALAAVLALLVWGRQAVDVSVPVLVARDFVAVVDEGTLRLERQTAQAAELEAFFATPRAGGPSQPVRVIDLAMMGFVLEGGTRHTLGGVPSALYSYRSGSGERIVCQMFEGRLEDLPPTADVRESNGFTFRVFREGDVTLVFWQEGEIVCVLVSRLPAEEVVKLAFAKAMRPA
jgi:anti-sigma factor RsiW